MMKLAAGDKAPDFHLPDQEGEEVALSDFAGKAVVVYFYPKDDTPGCTLEATQFDALQDRFVDRGVVVLGISPDNQESHRRFQQRYQLSIRLLSDPTHQVMQAYGAWGEKTRYGRTSVGVIRSTFLVDGEGRIVKAWYNVRADGHAAKVLASVSL